MSHPYRSPSNNPAESPSKLHKLLCKVGLHHWTVSWTVVLVLDGSVVMPDGYVCLCCEKSKQHNSHEIQDYTTCECPDCSREAMYTKNDPVAQPWRNLFRWKPSMGPVKAVSIGEKALDDFIKRSEATNPPRK